jgi:hypothetical protein
MMGKRPPPDFNEAIDGSDSAKRERFRRLAEENNDQHSPFLGCTPEQRAFLAALSELGTLTKAREVSGIGRWSHSNWMKKPPYRRAYQIARTMFGDHLEAEAVRRAKDGVDRPKFYKGRPIMCPLLDAERNPILDEDGQPIMVQYFETEYSDTLMVTLLKAYLPGRYRERKDVKIRTTNQRVAGSTPQEAIDAARDRLLEIYRDRQGQMAAKN